MAVVTRVLPPARDRHGSASTRPGTVYPWGNRPLTSNVNFPTGLARPNAVITPVSSRGTVCFYVNTDTDLLAEVSGWFGGLPVPT